MKSICRDSLQCSQLCFFTTRFRGYAADAMSVMPYPRMAPSSKYGYLGIQLFFMISGCVILMIAAIYACTVPHDSKKGATPC